MSLMRTMVVYFENPTKHENLLCGQSAGFLNVEEVTAITLLQIVNAAIFVSPHQ